MRGVYFEEKFAGIKVREARAKMKDSRKDGSRREQNVHFRNRDKKRMTTSMSIFCMRKKNTALLA